VIKEATTEDLEGWVALRLQLWPHSSSEAYQAECLKILGSDRETCFIAYPVPSEKEANGFVEVSTRPYSDGCDSSPVGYIEGLFVSKGHRRKGLGKELIEKSYEWFLSKGCSEVGSDALIDNEASISFHKGIGFEEVERQVVFRKSLRAVNG
jgi:aminoglycoside 6'-N-acetyltransferase I